MKHSAHSAHAHKVHWAYVNNALACRKLWRCSYSTSVVSYEPNDIDSLIAMSSEFLLKYPCGDSIMLLARISLSSSDFGSRSVHIRKSGLLGNGALTVPLPAFWPSPTIHVFRNVLFWDFYISDWSIARWSCQPMWLGLYNRQPLFRPNRSCWSHSDRYHSVPVSSVLQMINSSLLF